LERILFDKSLQTPQLVLRVLLMMVDGDEVESDDEFVRSEMSVNSFFRRSADAGDQSKSARRQGIDTIAVDETP